MYQQDYHFDIGNYFYKLAEISQDVFSIWDIDYRKARYISPAFERIWGRSVTSLTEASSVWRENVYEEDLSMLQKQMADILALSSKQSCFSYRYRIVWPNREVRMVEERCFPIYSNEQQLLGFAAITEDITKEKKSLDELRKASRFFRYFEERVSLVFWARDSSCEQQIYVSPGYEKIWQRSRESLYKNPQHWLETLLPEDQISQNVQARMLLLDEKGPNVEYEGRYRILTPDGDLRWIKDVSFPIYDEQHVLIGFAGVAEDITREVYAQEALEAATKRAEVANEAKSNFLAMISHELRTPLNAILGIVQILKMKTLTPEWEDYVNMIQRAGYSLLTLVTDLLDFARLEAGKLIFVEEVFDFKELIIQLVQSMQYQAKEKQLDISLEFNSQIDYHVLGDANRIKQVLINLLSNAIKYTEAGSIAISVYATRVTPEEVSMRVEVMDTGIGIPLDKLTKIFDKFTQINEIYRRKQSGIGLGLTIAKELAVAMRGEITVSSEVDKGSTFNFTLPLKIKKTGDLASYPYNDYSSDHVFKCHAHILLVEDNLINQKIAVLMLQELGCSVDIIDKGQQVIDNVASLMQYDIIYMDIGLPDVDGFEVVRYVRAQAHLKQLPVIAMTAHVLEYDKQLAMLSGVNQIVSKPINLSDIRTTLKTYAGHRVVS